VKKYAVLYKVNELGQVKHVRCTLDCESIDEAIDRAAPKRGVEWMHIHQDEGETVYTFPVSMLLGVQVAKVAE
jgi:hypothetical protein